MNVWVTARKPVENAGCTGGRAGMTSTPSVPRTAGL